MFGRAKKDSRADGEAVDAEAVKPAEAPDGADGPYDADDAPNDAVPRLDFGSLRIPNSPEVKVQVEFVEKTHAVRQVQMVAGDSEVHVGVFAAPRSEDVWDEAREEIVKSVHRQGGSVEEVDGPYGAELLVRGKGQNVPVRYAGISGPRWLIRAVFRGPRAEDETASPALDEALRGVVVERGSAPMPVLDALPLRMPPEARQLQEQLVAKAAARRKAAAAPKDRVNAAPAAKQRKPSPKPRKR